MIVYKETDECYIEWWRVTTNGNEWQWMATSDNECYNKWLQMTVSGTTSDNELQWVVQGVVQRVTANSNDSQRVTSSGTTNENGTVHLKEWMIGILSMTFTDRLL